jgi:MYXO-CTERM domain-containing protein
MTNNLRARLVAAHLAAAAVAFASFGVGCASGDGSPRGGSEGTQQAGQAIVGGTADTADTFVVGINIGGFGSCSGSLIAPNLVLTARHCVSQTSNSNGGLCLPTDYYNQHVTGDYGASQFRVTQAQNMYQSGITTWRVSKVWYIDDASCPSADKACNLCGVDLALLELTKNTTGSAFPAATYAIPSFAPPNTGDQFTCIGYGLTSPTNTNSSGKRMVIENQQTISVSGYDINVYASVCEGDSGGPYWDRATNKLYGALSRGDTNCTQGTYTRVDAHMAWLQAKAKLAAADGGYTAPSWVNDPAPAQPAWPNKVGELCTATSQCVDGYCPRYDTTRRCSQPCSSTDSAYPKCPSGFDCVKLTSGEWCWPHSDNPPPKPDAGVVDTGTPDTGVPVEDTGVDPGADTGPEYETITTTHSGCSVEAPSERPPRPVPWIFGAIAFAAALVARRRR